MEWGAGLLPHISGEAKRQGMAWVPVSPSMTRAIGLTSLYMSLPWKDSTTSQLLSFHSFFLGIP